jgi:hypothetical protein
MSINIKRNGAMPTSRPYVGSPTPKAGEADAAIGRIKRAVCNCATGVVPTYVYDTPVPVTIKRRLAGVSK